jgi:hypothetical protein
MKPFIKPLAAAVSLALISVSAHAALSSPAVGTTAPGSTGLYLSVWDGTTNSEVVNLSYAYADVALATGSLTPNSATSPFTSATNPSTGTGSVLQLNFGVIPGFSSLFTSANIGTTDYMVTSALSGGAGTEAAAVTSATTPVTAYSGLNGLISNVQGEIAAWAGDPSVASSGYATNTDGKPAWSVQTGLLKSGNLISGQQFGGAVGTSLNFYNLTTTTNHKETNSPYANATGDGFWFLSTSGDLTYNIASSGGTAPVPLPAAVWLLGSGLLGMAGIGRRRRNAA